MSHFVTRDDRSAFEKRSMENGVEDRCQPASAVVDRCGARARANHQECPQVNEP